MTVSAPGLVGLGPSSLHSMRAALERTLGEQAAAVLQEVGYASGPEVYRAFADWLRDRANVSDPAELDASFLGQMLSEFFESIGWGAVTLQRLGDAALALDAVKWAEAGGDTAASVPSCHFSSGMLSAFMNQLADDLVAVMQVECLTCRDERCRFLIGSPATLQSVFEAMTSGQDYGSVLYRTPASKNGA